MAFELRERVLKALRACHTADDLVALDEQMLIDHRDWPLHRLICEALRDRSVAPVEAASWLTILMDHRNHQLNACLNLSCQV